MAENHFALIVSVLSLIGTAVNMWLKLQIRLEVLQMRKAILDEVDAKYVRLPQSIQEARRDS
jgi:hypothetical protein